MARDEEGNEVVGKELRLMLRAAREEGKEEVSALLSKFGFKSVRDLETVLDAAEHQKREKDRTVVGDKSKGKDDDAVAAREAARAERELRETLLDAGVKKSELDLAVAVVSHKTSRMTDAQRAKFDPEEFAKEFKASNPQAFRDYDPDKAYRERREAEDKKAADERKIADEPKAKADAEKAKTNPPPADKPSDPPPGDKATTGLPSQPGNKPTEKPSFNAMKASKEEVANRMAEIKILAAKPPVFTEGQ